MKVNMGGDTAIHL